MELHIDLENNTLKQLEALTWIKDLIKKNNFPNFEKFY